MVILALDTSTATGSMALAGNEGLVECRVGDPSRTHGERLPGDILMLMEDHGTALSAIDLYSVCSGPGSFTGLRVGLATVQALALVHGRPVVAVPTLKALVYSALGRPSSTEATRHVGAWMNAHRGEVFGALYELSSTDCAAWRDGVRCAPLTELIGPMVGTPESVVAAWRESLGEHAVEVVGIDVAADAVLLLTHTLGERVTLIEKASPLAPILARIAALQKTDGTTGRPHSVQPVYVRRPDAELARERRQGSAAESSDRRP